MNTMRLRFLFFIMIFAVVSIAKAQPIVVSEYKNSADTPTNSYTEWTELVVINDNFSLVGYTLTDNNTGQTARQGGVRFKNIALWQHLRAGTVIVVNHRTQGISDIDASDGYIEFSALNTNVVDTVQYASGFDWNNACLRVAVGGDILEIIDPSDNHVHSLSHKLITGAYFNSLATPKSNYMGNLENDSSVCIVPGANLAAYNLGSGISGMNVSSAYVTKGLPNQMSGDMTSNSDFWRSLRQPSWTLPVLTATPNGAFSQVALSWNSASDQYPTDGTTGYLILRSSSSTFTAPTDGTTYSAGQTIGSATIISIINSSGTTTFTDNLSAGDILCGNSLYYRIYAFRFGTDNSNGNSFNLARGRAYNETNYAESSVTKQPPSISISALGGTTFCQGNSVTLKCQPTGMNAYQWLRNSTTIPGATYDSLVATQSGSYSILVTGTNGCFTLLPLAQNITVTVNPLPVANIASITDQCLPGNSFSFTNTGATGSGTVFQWNFGGGATPATSTTENPTGIVYSTSGTKTVSLIITKDGCTSTAATKTFNVNSIPLAKAGNDVSVCKGSSVTLQASGGDTYLWSPATGLSNPNSSAPDASPTVTTKYKVHVTNSATGCFADDSLTVKVNDPPVAIITAENGITEACEGKSVNLIASAGKSWHWQNGSLSQNIRVFQSGFYQVDVKDSNGCSTTSAPFEVKIHPLPKAKITALGATKFCLSDSVALKASDTASTGTTYSWSTGEKTQQIITRKEGKYFCTVTNTFGCSSRDSIEIFHYHNSIALSGSSAEPLDFGQLDACKSSIEDTSLAITDLGIDGTDVTVTCTSANFTPTPPIFHLKGLNDSQRLKIRFTPTSAGTFNGEIIITTKPCNSEVRWKITGSKVQSNTPKYPSAVSYGRLVSCDTTAIDSVIVIKNTSSTANPFTIQKPQIPVPFTILSPSTFPQIINSGDSLLIKIRLDQKSVSVGTFQKECLIPFSSGSCNDTLRITFGGLKESPKLSVSLNSVVFQKLLGCESSRDTIITVFNIGSTQNFLTYYSNSKDFSADLTTATIAPSDSVKIHIHFEPQSTGALSQFFALRSEPCGLVDTVKIQGEKLGISFAHSKSDIQYLPIISNCSPNTFAIDSVEITNTSEADTNGTVESFSFKNAGVHFKTSLTIGTTIAKGKSNKFEIKFLPQLEGNFEDTLLIHLQPCNISKTIVLKGTHLTAKIDRDIESTDLGQLPIFQSKNATVSFTNSGSAPLTIDSLRGVVSPFSYAPPIPNFPIVLAKGGQLQVSIKFTPTIGGKTTATMQAVVASPCSIISDTTKIYGEGLVSTASLPVGLAVSIPLQLTAKPREIVYIPITVKAIRIDTAGISSVQGVIKFNPTLLAPLALETGAISSGFNTKFDESPLGTVNFTVSSATQTLQANGVIAELKCEALLGSSRTTPIELVINPNQIISSKFIALNPILDGIFLLQDTCQVSNRIVDVSGKSGIIRTGGNPILNGETTIDFETVSDDLTTLELFNNLGQKILTLANGIYPVGVHSVEVKASALPSGIYYAIFSSGTNLQTVVLMIEN